MGVEEVSFQIILHGGNARNLAIEAMQFAKEGKKDQAEERLQEANGEIRKAHQFQTNLIQAEARGEHTEIRLLLIHAQDHLMNAMTVLDLSKEIVFIHERIK